MRFRDMVQFQVHSGNEVTVGDVSLIPQSQAFVFRTPYGGWVWNRPVAVVVRQAGQERRLPIPNPTLMARLAMLGLSFVLAALSLIYPVLSRRK